MRAAVPEGGVGVQELLRELELGKIGDGRTAHFGEPNVLMFCERREKRGLKWMMHV